jgi:hypothetical protein
MAIQEHVPLGEVESGVTTGTGPRGNTGAATGVRPRGSIGARLLRRQSQGSSHDHRTTCQ